jgi:hypothetical protein
MKDSRGFRLFFRLTCIPPFLAAIATMVGGTLLFLCSVPLNLSSVACSSGKHGGFVYEINWVVNFVLVLPGSFYLAGLTMASIGSTIKNLAASRMLVSATGQPLTPDEALQSWYELGGKIVPICVLLVLAAMGEAMGEWYKHSYVPLSQGTVQGLQPEYSCTWAVAGAVRSGSVNLALNHIFSFAAFLGQGIATSFYLSLVAIVLAFAYWVDRFNRRPDLPDLVPSFESDDPRLGFEQLEPFVQNLFAASLSFTIALFLVRLQFLYFGDSGTAANVYAFVLKDVAAGFFSGVKALFSGDVSLLDAGTSLVFSTVGSIAGFLILLMVALLIVSTVLRQAAIRARDVFDLKRDKLRSLWPNLTSAEQSSRIKAMRFWPLSYPGPLHLLLIMTFSAAAFIAYKLTLIVVGITVALGAKRFYAILSDGGDSPDATVRNAAPPGSSSARH